MRPSGTPSALHRPGPGADHAGHADRARCGNLVEGPLLADGARHAVSHRQDLRPEVARRLKQDPAQALPGRAPDHRRRQRALGARSRPIRILLCDEVDRYPFSAGAEGDPVNLAKKRTVTFWNRKIVLVSTPTIRGVSRIETAYARERSAAILGAVPELRRASGAGMNSGALGEPRRGSTGRRLRAITAPTATWLGRTHCAGPPSARGSGVPGHNPGS